jgi:hypothetical protein
MIGRGDETEKKETRKRGNVDIGNVGIGCNCRDKALPCLCKISFGFEGKTRQCLVSLRFLRQGNALSLLRIIDLVTYPSTRWIAFLFGDKLIEVAENKFDVFVLVLKLLLDSLNFQFKAQGICQSMLKPNEYFYDFYTHLNSYFTVQDIGQL